MTRQLRKGRDQCGATRRDGQPCEAPAVEGLLVCRRHGGGTFWAQVASERYRLGMRYFIAERDWMEARGTKEEDAALTRHGDALSEFRHFEERVAYLRVLQAEVRRRKAEAAAVSEADPMQPPVFPVPHATPLTGEARNPMEASPTRRASRTRADSGSALRKM